MGHYTADDMVGLNVGRGHGIYQGNIHGEVSVYRSLVVGSNIVLISGSQDIIISGSDSHISGVFQPALYNNRVSWMSAEGFTTVTASFDFRSITSGTLSAREITATNLTSLSKRVGLQTQATNDHHARALDYCKEEFLVGFVSSSIRLGRLSL